MTRPDGTPGLFGVVEVKRPAAFVVALTDDDEVVLVEIDRYTVGRSLELPAGGIDDDEPLVGAQRELLEETGYGAREWRPLGVTYANNGVCRAPMYSFLALGAAPDPALDAAHTLREQRSEGIGAVRTLPWAQVMGLVRDGELADGESVAALSLAALALGRLAAR